MNKQSALHKSAITGFSAIALSMLAFSAQALPIVTNGDFQTTMGHIGNTTNATSPTSGSLFTSDKITGPGIAPATIPGWNATGNGKNIGIGCVVFPDTWKTNNVCGPSQFSGSGFQAGGPGLSPDGGNFVLIDGDRDFPVSTTLYQTLMGLIVGQEYEVFFYQAAAQFLDKSGDTTERWDVSLGGNPAVFDFDGNITGGQHKRSRKMINPNDPNNPNDGFQPWEEQRLRFTVTDPNLKAGDITSQVLGFFSDGFPGGQPPIVLLDGVKVTAVPEPETLALLGIGLLGVLATSRQQKKRA